MNSDKTMMVELQEEVPIQDKTPVIVQEPYKERIIITGFKKFIIHTKLKFSLIKIAIKCYRNPKDWIKALHYLIQLRKRYLSDHKLHKLIYVRNKYYMDLYTPGWNSQIYKTFITSQLNDFKPIPKEKINRFNTIFIAITKKCPLQCEHCYEWENLNNKEVLSLDKINRIVSEIQDKGVSQIQFAGGEPLIKFDLLINILKQADKSTDLWINTSGYKLTSGKAKQLKEAGLTGAVISLEHFIPEKHNTFRGSKDAYLWAEEAIKNANQNNLITALSLCVTKDFVSHKNLVAYMELAEKLKVSFVQILEPKRVGHFANKDVLLKQNHIQILEEFYLNMNFNSAYNSYPIITYHEYYQRRYGCFNGGYKGMYIDTDGDINPCPFCHNKKGSVLDGFFEENLNLLKKAGCKDFKFNT